MSSGACGRRRGRGKAVCDVLARPKGNRRPRPHLQNPRRRRQPRIRNGRRGLTRVCVDACEQGAPVRRRTAVARRVRGKRPGPAGTAHRTDEVGWTCRADRGQRNRPVEGDEAPAVTRGEAGQVDVGELPRTVDARPIEHPPAAGHLVGNARGGSRRGARQESWAVPRKTDAASCRGVENRVERRVRGVPAQPPREWELDSAQGPPSNNDVVHPSRRGGLRGGSIGAYTEVLHDVQRGRPLTDAPQGRSVFFGSPSSRGLGFSPFKAETRVRIPLGTPPSLSSVPPQSRTRPQIGREDMLRVLSPILDIQARRLAEAAAAHPGHPVVGAGARAHRAQPPRARPSTARCPPCRPSRRTSGRCPTPTSAPLSTPSTARARGGARPRHGPPGPAVPIVLRPARSARPRPPTVLS